jgi:hypothetical protein
VLNSTVLDVGIGLIFVYLILGFMCTTVNEWIAQTFKMRAATLQQGIHALLDGPLARLAPLTSADAQITPATLNIPKLVARLITPGDKLAAAMNLDSANSPGPEALSNIDDDARQALASSLNSLLEDKALFSQIDTSKVSPDTLAAAQKAHEGGVRLANFNLLAEAYPDEIGGLIHAFYDHPLIKSLSKPGAHPSYVPARTFVAAILDILRNGQNAGFSMDSVRSAIDDLPDGDAKRSLLSLAQGVPDVAAFEKRLDGWFNDAMDRVSGWYKTKTQIVTALVAAGITIFANADTVQISRKLFVTPTERGKIVAEASVASKTSANAPLTASEKADLGELTGWSSEFTTFNRMKAQSERKPDPQSDAFPGFDLVKSPGLFWNWLVAIVPVHLLGWLLTAIAVSLGAPFWFDTLNKFMNIRAAGTAPNEKGSDKSKA